MDSQAPSGDFVDCDFDLPDDVDGALLMELLDDVVDGGDDNQGRAAEIPGPDDDVDDGAGWVSSGEADHVSIDEWSGPAAACRIDGPFDWEAMEMEMDGGWYVESLCMGEGFDDYVHGDFGFSVGEPYVVEQDCSPLWE